MTSLTSRLLPTLVRVAVVGVIVGLTPLAAANPSDSGVPKGKVFVSSANIPLLRNPEGITAWYKHVFVGTYNYQQPNDSRIFVFDADTGSLESTIGDKPGQELVSAGAV